jgi:hypothetical protein
LFFIKFIPWFLVVGDWVDRRRLVRRAAAEMGNPVVITNRQNSLLERAVLRRLIIA